MSTETERAKFFGAHLRELRQRASLTQQALANTCGVARNSINMIEAGRRFPSMGLLKKICDAVASSDQMVRLRLLFALLDEEPTALAEGVPMMLRVQQQANQSLWVVSDEFRELFHGTRAVLDATIAALRNGHERVYFVPDAAAWTRLVDLLRQERIVGLEQRLWIVSAPPVLCAVQAEIEPLPFGRAKAWVPADVSDPTQFILAEIPVVQACGLYCSLRNTLHCLMAEQAVPGFALLYPARCRRRRSSNRLRQPATG